MNRDKLIQTARKLLARDPNSKALAQEFAEASIRDAVIVRLENVKKKARYEIVLDAETGEFIFSKYRSPNTDGAA